MANQRKNQRNLSEDEWKTVVAAINAMHGIGTPAPAYRDFVRVHVDAMSAGGMQWGVHRMRMSGMLTSGRNFLAWHRRFLWQFEQRLQVANPSVTLPYWDWVADPGIPVGISDPQLLQSWGVSRQPDLSLLPTQAEVAAVMAKTSFLPFQQSLEGLHDNVHGAVGGTMDTSSSPADPIFFLHHANIDRLWSNWQQQNSASEPPNQSEELQPPPLFAVTVASQLSIGQLAYQYE
jgi:hypothetical protein